MSPDEHMDELGTLFVEECHECGEFAVAIRLVGGTSAHLIFRKVPMGALAKLLRDAADVCEAQAEKLPATLN